MGGFEPGVELSQLAWVPNTHELVFNTRLLYDYGLAYTDDLHMVDADTQKITLLLPFQSGSGLSSPNGKHIAMVTPTEIRLMGLDGNNLRTALQYPSVAIPSEFAYYAHPVGPTNSKSLMVAIPPTDVYYESTSPTTIWYIPADGGPAVVIAEIEAERGQYIEISPDFSKIAILEVINYGNPAEYYELHIRGYRWV